MKQTIFFFLFLISFNFFYSQKTLTPPKIGKVSIEELQMTSYEKDTTATAVVLYEWGNNYFDIINNQIRLVKKYYSRIKILKKEGTEHATISIPYYHTKKSKEVIKKITAVSHNNDQKIYVNKNNIYKKDINKNWSVMEFTFPKAAVGSVLEYEYTLITPYDFNFEGWEFQGYIPKIHSEFNASIFGNYRYNRVLKGSLKLSTNEASIKKRCLYIPGFPDPSDCEVLKYIMKDIPAFIEEDYMLAEENYISKIEFQLSEYYYLNKDRGSKKFTKTWKTVDKEFRNDKDIGRQLKKTSYFKELIPADIKNISDELERAKRIFYFIQDHYTWNEEYGIFKNDNIKRSYEDKTGNVAEINLSLINALLATGLKTELLLLSTRNNGLPTKLHPVITDFNYLVAKLTIGEQSYLLDASLKKLPFGILPYKALNYEGRVMDFKNSSYWHTITPNKKNSRIISLKLRQNDEGKLQGTLKKRATGYFAISKRENITDSGLEEYYDALEESIKDVEITPIKMDNLDEIEPPLSESYTIVFNNSMDEDIVFFNPFVGTTKINNPFKLKNRLFPVDYGYPRDLTYLFNMKVPDGYTLDKIPDNKIMVLSDHSVKMKFTAKQTDNIINIRFELKITKTHFSTDEYHHLKEFFSQIVALQNNAMLTFKKIK